MKALRIVVVWAALLVLACGFAVVLDEDELPAAAPVTVLQGDLAAGNLRSVEVRDDGVVFTPGGDRGAYRILGYVDDTTWEAITAQGIPVTYEEPKSAWLTVALSVLAVVLLLVALGWFVRRQQQQQNGGQNWFTMRKSTARLVKAGVETLKFSDVGGAEEAKERLADVVDLLRNPKRWTDAGVRLPHGVLLEGPPGCGKTLLARAVAGEAGVPVYVVSASEFVEMFVGVGASRIRDLFETAVKNAPAVVFIDELDAVGRRRGSGIGAGHDEREQTLNQLLVSMDGFEPARRVVVIAATNRGDVLDRALLRPGRFDVRVTIPPPDEAARLAILRIHTRGKKLTLDISLENLAARTAGWTGAELEHLCNEAAMAAVRRTRGEAGPVFVTAADIDRFLNARVSSDRAFDRLDQVLLESASQLARPTGPANVRLSLLDGSELEGALVWADASFLKVQPARGDARIVPKAQITGMRALAGTEAVAPGEDLGDPWAGRSPDLA